MGKMIDIKCNNCEYYEQIAYGDGFAGNHDFFYCPKCFKLSEYFTSINEIIEFSKFLNCRIIETKRCHSCNITLKPFNLKFFAKRPEIKGPTGFRCPECNSKDLKYKEVGLWD